MLNAAQSYRQAQVNTVGRADITLMLYDGLLRFLDLAAEKMEEKKIQEKGNYISRALDIINELDSTLNMEKGGDVSKGLHQLYLITNKNLLMANLKNDIDILKSVRKNMQVVRDSFFEAMQTEEAKAMLLKMGPVPVSSSGGGPINLGGSIQERSNNIKEAQQKVEAIKRAKAQLENAKTDEEKLLAQKELESLLGKSVLAAQNKPVSVSMAQKASRAFLQQGAFRAQQMPQAASTQAMQGAAGQHPVMQLKSHGNLIEQDDVSAGGQQASAAQSLLYKQGALFGQKTMKNIANTYGSRSVCKEELPMADLQPELCVSEEQNSSASSVGIEKKPVQSPLGAVGTTGTLGAGQMGGLLSKKMSLYKNS